LELQNKLVENREAAHEELSHREELQQLGDEVLPAPIVEAVRDAALEMRGHLLGAVRMILDRETLNVHLLKLPALELRGLEALQVAVEGRSSDLGQFVYASDRRDMLEQALAVLQPNMTRADELTARELHAQFADLSSQVAELRDELLDLEDAQDELLEGNQKDAVREGTEPTDKPKPKPGDPDAPRPATTLTGPDRAEPPTPASTLAGPDRPEPPRPVTTLSGPELPPQAPAPTTLTGPDLPPDRAQASTLTGPELPPEPAEASTLGDAADVEAAAKKHPWWRRPFG
jgi:hypothetical protein